MTQHEPYHAVVAALDRLTDAELCAIVARTQSLLLDRPDAADGTAILTVEVVAWDEAWVLAHYRALPQPARRRLLQSLDGTGRDTALSTSGDDA